ncbi:MAG: S-methyl-5'-thioinosine phosphorylase [Gallionella sp.]|nr:S-methyl-5'-thioinosine phosphorylase [Gallionella sp.]MDD4947461.1 S-methyl-5'-thioinosine phosphorylase [Gallionella sp.]
MLAIIGGRGLTQLANLKITHRQVMRTPYGEPSCAFLFGILNGHEVIFLARHGYGYTIPPHLVNYRANLWALREQGVMDVVSVATVGGIRGDMVPGTLVLPDQVIDYTHGRDSTYFDSRNMSYSNIDFSSPYSQAMRRRILHSAALVDQPCLDGGTYAATQGPRLDSMAEIDRYERDGAHMVGMTGMPEVALAMELDMNYATIAVVANYAAGRGDSRQGINMETLNTTAERAMERVRAILECVVNCHDD